MEIESENNKKCPCYLQGRAARYHLNYLLNIGNVLQRNLT